MTQVFAEDGTVSPATIISAGPVTVTRVKELAKDGYRSYQVGFGAQKPHRVSKPVLRQNKGTAYRVLRECRIFGDGDMPKEGEIITSSLFKEGDLVAISGLSKGKGFQGVVKRHGFHGGPRSHGQKHSEREPGSISGGLRTGPRKGKKMAGRMGGDRVTINNLKILKIDEGKNTIVVSGAVPGRRGTLLEIVEAQRPLAKKT